MPQVPDSPWAVLALWPFGTDAAADTDEVPLTLLACECEPRPWDWAASAASRARVDRLRMRALPARVSVPAVLLGVPSCEPFADGALLQRPRRSRWREPRPVLALALVCALALACVFAFAWA